MKIVEFTQIRPTPFRDGILGNSWWYWFKHMHLELNISHAKELEVCKAHGLIANTCKSFYINLQTLYNQHSHVPYHVWNSYEIGIIQVSKQARTRVLAQRWSNVVYNIITKSWEWLIINCVLNVTRFALLSFYIFMGEKLQDDYIKFCKLGICM